MMVFPPANALYRRETYDNYPAARAIMQVVYEGLQLPMDQALRVESRYFAKILRSPEAAAMIRSLFVSMQELNKGARRPADVPAKPIKKIGVLGAGFMGAGVAYVTAQAGIDVVLIDRDQEAADKGKAHSQKLITDQINRGRATAADRDALLARITATPDYAALKDCDLIIEAVFEDRKVKEEAIAKAQAVIGKDTIFGSNTSTLPITSLATSFKDPPRFIGIHFFSPVDRMMLVEVIMGKKTGDEALAIALDYVRAIRKTPIVVNDSRGFYTSRVVGTYIREGHLMLAEGVPAAMIENVGRMAGMPVGPLSLNDEVAVDLAWKILKATEADLGADKIDQRQKALLEDMVEKRGRYGRKNGKGFYDYPQSGPKRLWPGLADLQPTKLDPDTIDVDELKARLLGDPGAGIRPLHRGRRGHRRARSRCRLDPRLRLCAVHRRHHFLYRRHGHQGLRRSVQRAGEEIWRPLQAGQALARHGQRPAKASITASRRKSARPRDVIAALLHGRRSFNSDPMARDQVDLTPIERRDELVDWIAQGIKPKSQFRIGTEHEKFAFTLEGHQPVPYEGRRGIRSLLEGMEHLLGWQPIMEGDKCHRPVRRDRRRRHFARAWRPVRIVRRASRNRAPDVERTDGASRAGARGRAAAASSAFSASA